jgi:23S rRNA maturation-related 3'-5' exoribonuclease YhaM
MKIIDIKPKTVVSGIFLVKEISFLKTKDNGNRPYTAITFKDKSGEIRSFCWDKHLTLIRPGTFVKLTGNSQERNEEVLLSFKDSAIHPVKQPENLEDYILSLDSLTINRLWEELIGIVNGVQDKFYREILNKIISQHETLGIEFNLKNAPYDAHYGAHFAGALLEHMIYCLRHVKTIHHNYYDRNCPIDPDFLVAATICRSVGRLRKYENIFAVQESQRGKTIPLPILSWEILKELVTGEELLSNKFLKLEDAVLADENRMARSIEGNLVQFAEQIENRTVTFMRFLKFSKNEDKFIWVPELNLEIFNI